MLCISKSFIISCLLKKTMSQSELFSDSQYEGDIKEEDFLLGSNNSNSQITEDGFVRDVFLPEDRIKVTDTTKPIYRWICKLYMYPNSSINDQRRRIGTGTFIAPNVVLTAAHNVWNDDLGGWASRIEVIPALNGQRRPYGETSTSHYICCKGWIDTRSSAYDFALIYTQKSFGPQYGMGFAYAKKENLEGQNIEICGYPVDLPKDQPALKGKYQYLSKNNVLKIDSDILHYKNDTEGGQSGAGIIYYNNQRKGYYICGIHGAGPYGNITTNTGTHITSTIFDIIQTAKQGKHYESSTDRSYSTISSK
jgi:V8-like Glu-specific endopeptidase